MEMQKFIGKWQVTEMHNFENMMKAMGTPEEGIKALTQPNIIVEYQRDGDLWENSIHLPGGGIKTVKFRVGQEYNSETLDGRPIRTLVKFEDGKFVEDHMSKTNPNERGKMVKTVQGDELTVESTMNGVSAVVKHKRVK